jgi:MGT family glycosyltransferase
MREKPDYIIHDSLCTWAKHVAMISGIPAVNTITTLVMVPDGVLLTINYLIGLAFVTITNTSNMKRISNITKALKRNKNIDVKSLVDTLENKEKMNIVYTSKEFQPKSGKLKMDYRIIGPESMYRNVDNTDFGFDNKESRILLFISMGSIFNNNMDFFNKCVEAFGNTNISVLMSVGSSIDITSIKVPDNFSVKYYYDIPQLEVLKKCDVFITHGGMNSTHEGLFNGIPLIIIPQQDEQAYVAKQVVRSGSGICLKRAKVTAKVLKESVKKVTSDKSFRINALKMRASFISAGGPERAAKEIFTFVGNMTGINL